MKINKVGWSSAGIFLALVGMCIFLAVIKSRPEPVASTEEARAFAGLLTFNELAHIHINHLEQNEHDRLLWDFLLKGFLDESQLIASWRLKFVYHPDQPLADERRDKAAIEKMDAQRDMQLTDFERQAIKKIENGEREVIDWVTQSELLYLRRLHPDQVCKTCHHVVDFGVSRPLESYISIQVHFKKQ